MSKTSVNEYLLDMAEQKRFRELQRYRERKREEKQQRELEKRSRLITEIARISNPFR
jgi:Skp family chaperone for outer membrane proteins